MKPFPWPEQKREAVMTVPADGGQGESGGS